MSKIFISYKQKDKDTVLPIVKAIKQETGMDCWIDLEGIEGGDLFQNVIIDAIDQADALLLLTEWKEFRLPNWNVIAHAMRRPLVIDGRNIFDAKELREAGIDYHCIGQ